MKTWGLVIVGLAAIAGIIYEGVYWRRVYTGVRVGGIRIENLTLAEVEAKLEANFSQDRTLVLRHEDRRWTIGGEEMGLVYNWRQTAWEAMRRGRTGNILDDVSFKISSWRDELDIKPVWNWNEAKVEEVIAAVSGQINILARSPEAKVDVTSKKIEIEAGENGWMVDERGLKQRMAQVLEQAGGREITIPVVEIKPRLAGNQVEEWERRIGVVLEKRISLELPEGGDIKIDGQIMANWMDPYDGGWREEIIEEYIGEMTSGADRPAQNASLRFEGGRVVEFRPAKEGFRIERKKLVNEVIKKLSNLETGEENEISVNVSWERLEPMVQTGEVNSLGIRELIGKGESWYAGSITNRIYNLKRAAEALNGVLVAPGETFSFNKTVGKISAATGYKQAFIIKEGKTILGDGGGVCQTSTTLFRAVLAAGLPIEERTAHAYRVSYYEQSYQVGFDATVFQPAPDFKFKNDTPGHILIQTVFDEEKKYLAFEIYGTHDGRKAELSKSRVWDVVPPAPDLYIDDPTLPVGATKQTEHKANGAKVAFDWKVSRGNEILQDRTFYSVYRPWRAVFLRGTKTN